MDVRFQRVAFGEIQGDVRRHLAALPSAIDSFLEDHILSSRHYRIVIDGEAAGCTSIHGGGLITQFALGEPWRHVGQPVYRQVRRLEEARSAFVPTCDEFYLAHALDDFQTLAMQAYFFALGPEGNRAGPASYAMRPAVMTDAERIRREAGDFFDPVERYIEQRELFVTLRNVEAVAYGLLTPSALYDAVASIGMFTSERFRQQGAGTATIALLIEECQRRGLHPVAGCWYYNHASKRTLERAGMYAGTRLLKIDY